MGVGMHPTAAWLLPDLLEVWSIDGRDFATSVKGRRFLSILPNRFAHEDALQTALRSVASQPAATL